MRCRRLASVPPSVPSQSHFRSVAQWNSPSGRGRSSIENYGFSRTLPPVGSRTVCLRMHRPTHSIDHVYGRYPGTWDTQTVLQSCYALWDIARVSGYTPAHRVYSWTPGIPGDPRYIRGPSGIPKDLQAYSWIPGISPSSKNRIDLHSMRSLVLQPIGTIRPRSPESTWAFQLVGAVSGTTRT